MDSKLTHNPGRSTLLAIMAIAALVLVLALAPAHLMAQEDQGTIPGLTLTSASAGELVISWNNPEPAPSDYRISWAPTSKQHIGWQEDNEADRGNAYPEGTERSFTVTGLPAGEDYKVRMRARYNAGQYADDPWSGPWEKATITLAQEPEPEPESEPEPATTPSAPTGLSGRLQDGNATLSWTAPQEGVIGYRIFRGPSTKKLSTIVSDTGSTATSHTDDSVSAGNTYHYAVAAINSAGTGEQTATTSVTIPSAVRQDTPDTPTSTSEPNPGDLPSTTATTGVVAPDSAAKGYVKAVTDWYRHRLVQGHPDRLPGIPYRDAGRRPPSTPAPSRHPSSTASTTKTATSSPTPVGPTMTATTTTSSTSPPTLPVTTTWP